MAVVDFNRQTMIEPCQPTVPQEIHVALPSLPSFPLSRRH